MKRQSSERARIRRLRSVYRKRIAIWAIVMLIIGIILGIVLDHLLFNKQDQSQPQVIDTVTPSPMPQSQPVEDDDFGFDDMEGFVPDDEPGDLENEDGLADDEGEPFEDAQPEDEGDDAGEDYTISMEAATATPEPTPTPEPTLEPTATPVPGPTTIAVVPFGESYDFTTQINPDGTARFSTEDPNFETLSFTLTMKDYMLPSDFASKWGNVYKLQGTEAGAGFELTLHDYTGTATIVPQNIIKIVLQSESGNTENPGFQLMDAEIAGQPDVSVKSNEPKTLWKRYTFSNAGEPMEYLAVTTYNNGAVQTILFELESDVVPTPDPAQQYTTLSRGTKSDAVLDLQKRLIELGYLSGKADGSYGEKTQTAVTKAQKDFGMEENGTATPEFQVRLFSDEAAQTGEDSEETSDEAAEEETAEDAEN